MVVSVFTLLTGDSEIRVFAVALCVAGWPLPGPPGHFPRPPLSCGLRDWAPCGACPAPLEFQWRLHLVKSPSWSRLMLLASIFILSDIVAPVCVFAW